MARIHRTIQKDLQDPDIHNSVIIHLEPDILECKVKWALGSVIMNKASRGDGIPVKVFQILEDGAAKLLQFNMPANLENSAVATGLERSVFILIPKKGNVKECSNYRTIALNSQASKVMLKILQARLQKYVNCGLPDVQAGFRKGRGTREQIANIHWIIKKARQFQEKYLLLLY